MKLSGIISRSMRNFLCIRGFASFRDLGNISCADDDIQRDLIDEHREEMVTFLNSGEYTFFPEVILAMVLPNQQELVRLVDSKQGCNKKFGLIEVAMNVGNKTKSVGESRVEDIVPIVHLKFNKSDSIKIFRIDGNHRLSAYEQSRNDFNTPYCLLLFSSDDEYKRFSRAIFHNINSKQRPLTIEHNRKVIIEGNDTFSDSSLVSDPSFGWPYYLTRKTIHDIDFSYFTNINTYIGNAPCTFFIDLYKYLIRNGSIHEDDKAVETVKKQLVEIETALRESSITATTTNIAIIGALAYYKLTNLAKYRGFISWIKKNNLGRVEMLHIESVIKLYDEIFEHVPKKVFLARWYPSAALDGEDDTRKAESRINVMKEVAAELAVDLTDLGTRETGTFDIRQVMYHDIRKCDVFVADLSGARHNVMIEVGYALKYVETARMVFYFQKTDKCETVPFDVSHLNYLPIVDSSELKTEIKKRIGSIIRQAQNGEI